MHQFKELGIWKKSRFFCSEIYSMTSTFPKEFSQMECTMCGDIRELTDVERTEFNIGTKESYFESLKINKK